MGLLNRLFGRAEPPITDPGRLWEELFATVGSGDARRLERLARANEATILGRFDSWRTVPEPIRADPPSVQRHVHTLVMVAQVFVTRLGRPELMDSLTGTDSDNPIVKWQQELSRSRELLDDLRYDEARTILADALIDARAMSGTALDSLLPITHGYLAESYFQAGRAEESLPHLRHALETCERTGDKEGILAYLGSLFEAYRYFGQSDPAAEIADRLAAILPGCDADRWRTRARIVRAGEPLNRVVAVLNGGTSEVDEVRPTRDMRVRFQFERNRITLRPAVVGTERGERHSSAGRHEDALAAFETAALADPHDPHSHYLGAFALLHLGRYADAAERYRQVEALAPGWYHCRAEAWLADQLACSQLDHEDLLSLSLLEDGSVAPKTKLSLADELLHRRPGLPVGHLQRAKVLAGLNRRDEARKALKTGLIAEPEHDVRTRLLVQLATLTENPTRRAEIYREAIAVNGNLVAAATAAIALRGE